MKTIATLSAVATLALTVGASAFAADPAPASAPAAQRSCFFASQLNGWRSENNEKTIYLEVGAKDVYRVEMFSRCSGIDDALAIGVESRGGGTTICDALDLELIVRSPIGPQRCHASTMTKLTPDEITAMKAARKASKKPRN